MGQVSGIAFIFGMDGLKSETTGSMTYPLVGMIGLMLFGLILSTGLKESKILSVAVPNMNPDLKVNPVSVAADSEKFNAKKQE
jgi:hypothetical protein